VGIDSIKDLTLKVAPTLDELLSFCTKSRPFARDIPMVGTTRSAVELSAPRFNPRICPATSLYMTAAAAPAFRASADLSKKVQLPREINATFPATLEGKSVCAMH